MADEAHDDRQQHVALERFAPCRHSDLSHHSDPAEVRDALQNEQTQKAWPERGAAAPEVAEDKASQEKARQLTGGITAWCSVTRGGRGDTLFLA